MKPRAKRGVAEAWMVSRPCPGPLGQGDLYPTSRLLGLSPTPIPPMRTVFGDSFLIRPEAQWAMTRWRQLSWPQWHHWFLIYIRETLSTCPSCWVPPSQGDQVYSQGGWSLDMNSSPTSTILPSTSTPRTPSLQPLPPQQDPSPPLLPVPG